MRRLVFWAAGGRGQVEHLHATFTEVFGCSSAARPAVVSGSSSFDYGAAVGTGGVRLEFVANDSVSSYRRWLQRPQRVALVGVGLKCGSLSEHLSDRGPELPAGRWWDLSTRNSPALRPALFADNHSAGTALASTENGLVTGVQEVVMGLAGTALAEAKRALHSVSAVSPSPGIFAFERGIAARPVVRLLPSNFSSVVLRVSDVDEAELALRKSGMLQGCVGKTGQQGRGQLLVASPELTGLDLRFCEAEKVAPHFHETRSALLEGTDDGLHEHPMKSVSLSCTAVTGMQIRTRVRKLVSR